MSKIVTTIAVLMFAFAATASAQVSQDYRSPDARPAAAAQDFRSPDARSQNASSATQDLRSPDAGVSGRFVPAPAVDTAPASGSFQWGYLALAIAAALIGLTLVVVTMRRRRHGLAISS
jgi:hypothetical protein